MIDMSKIILFRECVQSGCKVSVNREEFKAYNILLLADNLRLSASGKTLAEFTDFICNEIPHYNLFVEIVEKYGTIPYELVEQVCEWV